jgi:thiol-disulfide isomerase/thioredoxin
VPERFSALGAVFILMGLLVACTGPGSAAPQGISEGNRGRDFTLESLDGSTVSLSDYRGNAVVLNFWASWCAPCRAEIPHLEAAYQAYKDDGLVILGVNVEESRQMIEPFVAEFAMTYPVLLDDQGRVMNEYRALGLPMSLVLYQEGSSDSRSIGSVSGPSPAGSIGRGLALMGVWVDNELETDYAAFAGLFLLCR